MRALGQVEYHARDRTPKLPRQILVLSRDQRKNGPEGSHQLETKLMRNENTHAALSAIHGMVLRDSPQVLSQISVSAIGLGPSVSVTRSRPIGLG